MGQTAGSEASAWGQKQAPGCLGRVGESVRCCELCKEVMEAVEFWGDMLVGVGRAGADANARAAKCWAMGEARSGLTCCRGERRAVVEAASPL